MTSDPMNDEPPESEASSSGTGPNAAVRQLESILQNLTTFATPVVREIAARAAELAAKAGEMAGPAAHKAAEVTEEVGERLAVKGHEVASGLRGGRTEESGTGPHGPSAPEPEHPASEEGPPPAP